MYTYRTLFLVDVVTCAFSGDEVNIGRYSNIPVNDRICKMCDSQVVEDEYHLLFQCNIYKSEQENWLGKLNLKIGDQGEQENLQQAFQKPHLLGKYLKLIINQTAKTQLSIFNF